MPTALLICMENTFWSIRRSDDFVELFKKSFKLYVESGMREVVEADIDIVSRDQSGHLETTRFCKIIIDHLLRKFYCQRFFELDTSNLFLCLQLTQQMLQIRVKLLNWNRTQRTCQ
jgi:hypothetical protein